MSDISLVLDSDSSDDDDNTSVDSNEGMDGTILTGINVRDFLNDNGVVLFT